MIKMTMCGNVTKDAEKKTHPCIVPYSDLPVVQRAKDYLFREVVHTLAKI